MNKQNIQFFKDNTFVFLKNCIIYLLLNADFIIFIFYLILADNYFTVHCIVFFNIDTLLGSNNIDSKWQN